MTPRHFRQLLENAQETIRICRDAATGKTQEECHREGIPYDEYADIEVLVSLDIGSHSPEEHPGAGRGYQPAEQDYEVISATAVNDCPKYSGDQPTGELLFKAGQPIDLTHDEEGMAFDRATEQAY